MLALTAFVNRSGTMVLPFLSLYLTAVQEMSAVEAGRILSLWGVGSVLGSLVGGWLADRVGTWQTQWLSLFGSGFAFLTLGFLETPGLIAVGVLVASLVVDAFRPACMSAVADWSPPGLQLRAFALIRLALNLGIGVAPAVGGFLALYDYHLLFFADALTCWGAASLLMLPVLARKRHLKPSHSEQRSTRSSPWRDGPFLALLLVTFLLTLVLFQLFNTFPLHLRENLGLREDAIGLIFALNPVLIVLFEMVLIHWTERFDRFRVLALGAMLLAGGFGLTPLGSTALFICFTVVVWTVGEMLTLPILNSIVAERSPAGGRGRYMGLFTMSFALGLVIAPLAGMTVLDRFGSTALWACAGLVGPIAAVTVLLLRRGFTSQGTARPPQSPRPA